MSKIDYSIEVIESELKFVQDRIKKVKYSLCNQPDDKAYAFFREILEDELQRYLTLESVYEKALVQLQKEKEGENSGI